MGGWHAGRKGSRLPPTSSASVPPDGGCRGEERPRDWAKGCRKHWAQNLKNQQLSSFFISSPSNKDHGRRQEHRQHQEENEPLLFSPRRVSSKSRNRRALLQPHPVCVGMGFSSARGRRGRVCTDESTGGSAPGFWSSRASAVTPMWGDPGSRAHPSGSLTKSPTLTTAWKETLLSSSLPDAATTLLRRESTIPECLPSTCGAWHGP